MSTEQSVTKFAKAAEGMKGSPILSHKDLPQGVIHGELQDTGIVVEGTNGRIIAAVRSTGFIPTAEGGFGGQQRLAHVEGALNSSKGSKVDPKQITRDLIDDLETESNLNKVSERNGGAFGVGVETEMVVHNQQGEVDWTIESVELTKGQKEEAHNPHSDPLSYVVEKSKYVLSEMNKPYHIESSAPISGTASTLQINDQREDIGPYVHVMAKILYNLLDSNYDSQSWEVWNQVAQNEGFKNMEQLFKFNGTLAPWLINALHQSIGVKHFNIDGKNSVRQEHLICTADLITSCLGAPLGWITASTPVMFGVEPLVNGTKIRDVRLDARHLLVTSGPDSQPIRDRETLLKRTIENIVNGRSHTIARAGYTSGNNGDTRAVMHGQARIRQEGKPDIVSTLNTGRVEATGMGATPSIIDQAAAMGYLQLIYALALEADLAGKPADIYANEKGFSSASDFKVREANSAFNQYSKTEQVSVAIYDAINLCDYMRMKYPALSDSAKIAKAGILRIYGHTASSFEKYLACPSGSFSDVVRNEYYKGGMDPVKLVRQIHSFELNQAKKILELSKDRSKLLAYLTQSNDKK